jgi:hypothetical protein
MSFGDKAGQIVGNLMELEVRIIFSPSLLTVTMTSHDEPTHA